MLMCNKWMDINTAPKDRRILLAYIVKLKSNWESHATNVFSAYWSAAWKGWQIENGTMLFADPIAWQELPVFDGVINV